MKFIVFLLCLNIFNSFSFAALTEIKESQLLALTGLEKNTLVHETEKSLEQHLFQDINSFVCGLQEFRIEYYQTGNDILNSVLKDFSVITEVFGPLLNCRGYEYYLCETDWLNIDSKWQVKNTTCENDNDFGPILTSF